MEIAKKESLVNFNKIKNHQIFDRLNTFMLEKVIYRMDKHHDLDHCLSLYEKSEELIKDSMETEKNYYANLIDSIP